jgi:hypothetical protein
MSRKTPFVPLDQQEEIEDQYAQGVEENNKRYQKTRNYTEHDKR